jgi:hypothetical protein
MYFILHQSSHQIVALSSGGAKSTIYQGLAMHEKNTLTDHLTSARHSSFWL